VTAGDRLTRLSWESLTVYELSRFRAKTTVHNLTAVYTEIQRKPLQLPRGTPATVAGALIGTSADEAARSASTTTKGTVESRTPAPYSAAVFDLTGWGDPFAAPPAGQDEGETESPGAAPVFVEAR
jgi:hypothetical protein